MLTGYHAEVSLDALNRHVQAFLLVQARPMSRDVIERSPVIYQHARNRVIEPL